MARKLFVILAMAMLFMANVVLAGEREVPRAGEVKVVYNDNFLPPHLVAGQELAELQEEWLVQELVAFLVKQEDKEDEGDE